MLPKDGNERYQLLLYVLSGYGKEEVQLGNAKQYNITRD